MEYLDFDNDNQIGEVNESEEDGKKNSRDLGNEFHDKERDRDHPVNLKTITLP